MAAFLRPEAWKGFAEGGAGGSFPPLRQVRLQGVAEVEARYLKELLAAVSGDIPEACALFRPRLYALLKKVLGVCKFPCFRAS